MRELGFRAVKKPCNKKFGLAVHKKAAYKTTKTVEKQHRQS